MDGKRVIFKVLRVMTVQGTTTNLLHGQILRQRLVKILDDTPHAVGKW